MCAYMLQQRESIGKREYMTTVSTIIDPRISGAALVGERIVTKPGVT